MLALWVLPAVSMAQMPELQAQIDRREQRLAYHIGVQAYIYGYPAIDLLATMRRETTRRGEDQRVYAPVNRFFNYQVLANPDNAGSLRAANNDTVYFTAWVDLAAGPVILETPDTGDRYYTIAISDLFAETQHVGRRTTGTAARRFLLAPPGWQGEVPQGMTLVRNTTPVVYLLGRMYSAGEDDLERANALIERFRLRPFPGNAALPERALPGQQDLRSVDFFQALNRVLREMPAKPGEAALMAQFDRIGIGPGREFDQAAADPARLAGLQQAVEEGYRLVQVASLETIEPGWIVATDLGNYGYDYLRRAGVVFRGTGANQPEESLYPANLYSADGKPLHGARRYTLHFEAGGLPPVEGFWSLSVYHADSHRLVENPIDRYSIGDRTEGLEYGEDGSLTLYLQAEEPSAGPSNWLPTPAGRFYVIARLYQPRKAALSGEYELPPLRAAD